MSPAPGFSGKIAARFYRARLTPLLALLGLLLGIFAGFVTPREEDPQIDVTMANVFVPFPGASVADVENLVAIPAGQVLGELQDVEHIYSVSRPGMAVLTVQFDVGLPRTEALVRLYNAVDSNRDWLPPSLGAGPVLVKPKSIDDVPIVTLTLWSTDPERGAFELRQIAHAMETELKRIPGTRNIYTIGGPEQSVRILLDPERLAARGMSIEELRNALHAFGRAAHTGGLVADNRYVPLQAGEFFSSPSDLAELVVGMSEGRPVYLEDVADIAAGPTDNTSYVWHVEPGAADAAPAVTLAISKKPSENATDIANEIIARVDTMRSTYIPAGVETRVTRNYGATANDKANKLIQKLAFATVSVILLVLFSLGWREAVVVGAAVVLTLSLTLFASWAWGFSLNRVSLFALIFSIGILVDDAIVVVENIHRHLGLYGRPLAATIPGAVDEVGGPTILATFTVIAALLPMAFVSGLMGPYMSPIPINASMGMLISLIVAITFTPWLAMHVLGGSGHGADTAETGKIPRLFEALMRPFLGDRAKRNRVLLFTALIVLVILAFALVGLRFVVMKMLPFDNKSEFQLVVDLPEGTPLEATNAVLLELADYLRQIPELTSVQGYAGTASPIGFNGLVRQYYLRQQPNLGDLQVNLLDAHERDRSSHEIARSVRPELARIAETHGAVVKVVEVPPGPPVMAPVVAEIYGPDQDGQRDLARELRARFENTGGMVDVDDSIEASSARLVLAVDRSRAARLGVSESTVVAAVATALGGEDVGYLHTGHAKYPVAVRLEFAVEDKGDVDRVLALKLRSVTGSLVPLSEVVRVREEPWQLSVHHKDQLPVVYVTGDMAGKLDSPLYGMFDVVGQLRDSLPQYFTRQPPDPYQFSVKWDGEWQITYETFRDMGAAYAVGLLLIYLLVVGQFGSYAVPVVIMTPIAFTLIGVLPGHAITGTQFSATSMIGVIALAGIIVRNSILLVDFMNQAIAEGMALERAVVRAASVRARPIVLTAVAAMLGALFILDDPIFGGLAVSLVSGLLVSTLLTLHVIPILYYLLLRAGGSAQAA